jgi:hypothetical protein
MDGTSGQPATLSAPLPRSSGAPNFFSSDIRALISSAPSSSLPTSTYGVDPPRPAREGFEWVWFPGGYWAERHRVELAPVASALMLKSSKWRKWSSRGSSSRETDKSDARSPISPKMQRSSDATPRAPMPSPYMSEADHVLSLQKAPESSGYLGEQSVTVVVETPRTTTSEPSPLRQSESTTIMGSMCEDSSAMTNATERNGLQCGSHEHQRPSPKKVIADFWTKSSKLVGRIL